MLKFRYVFFLAAYFAVSIILSGSQANADGYLTPDDLKSISYQCYVEDTEIVFCSDEKISNPQVIVKLPLLEPVILANGVRAYRVMATIDNQTKRNLIGARIFVTFDEDKKQSIDIMISEKIIYKATSTTARSHLIRSDVPQNLSLYEALDQVYFNAQITNIKIKLQELLFEEI